MLQDDRWGWTCETWRRRHGTDADGVPWEWRECWRRRRAAWSSGCTRRQCQKIGPRSKLKCDGECQWCCRRLLVQKAIEEGAAGKTPKDGQRLGVALHCSKKTMRNSGVE